MTQQIPESIPGGAIDLSHLAARSNAQSSAPTAPGGPAASGDAAQPGQVVDIPSIVIELTDQNFEQAIQLSTVVPVVVELNQAGSESIDVLETLVHEFEGRLVLARVDVRANPTLSQAFQVQTVPTAVAVIGGQPVPLFQGVPAEAQVRDLFQQLLQLAAQQGVTGRVNAPDLGKPAGENAESEADSGPQMNPAHADALAALERGDYAAAVEAYEQVLLKSPADQEAQAALAQVRLLHRLEGVDLDEARTGAASDPHNLEAQLRVADLDVSGGHVDDAFDRLLDLFAELTDDEDKTTIRERLLELFETVGASDPRVGRARARLANLLY